MFRHSFRRCGLAIGDVRTSAGHRGFAAYRQGESHTAADSGTKNIWEAPFSPYEWTAAQRAGVALTVMGGASYALLSGWLKAKKADKPALDHIRKAPKPPAPDDSPPASVGDAMGAMIPIRQTQQAQSNAPTATPALGKQKHGQVFKEQTGVEGRGHDKDH